ncbi:probable RNA methyltransferase CG11342 [Achroia grisella]|uniref:probable RNA methyltransferase CG11342 n=1 Tax=Achroia grisella TaxID=688607 RepID=UPI0027D23208|nr:probable RNA methyltransferase CG11342 [Achroia grisella]
MPKEDELNFMGTDPGAVKFGNFINYYSFHSAKQRIENLHPDMFPTQSFNEPLLCLDIGCNTGELTQELCTYLETVYTNKIYMLGIDIDNNLIQRANETNCNSNITFAPLDVMNEKEFQIIEKFLDYHKRKTFDITFCFSVTMWIHINNGDEGLKKFLGFLKKLSKLIIIEPQPWSCYRNAQRRVKKSGGSFPLYNELRIRSDVESTIEQFFIDDHYKKVYESINSSWNRKIKSFQIDR